MFDYKELDEEGFETLEAIAGASKFNQWMYETILPFCSGKVLEIGSGIGNISEFFLKDNFQICLSDIRDNYCEHLRSNFAAYPNLIGVEKMDVVDPDFDTLYSKWLGTFDTVFALNVVEHIENDGLAIKNIAKLLKPGGKIIILVPAYQSLYNRFDKELYHYRRYNEKALTGIFKAQGLKVNKSFYFNFPGIAGWYVSGKLQNNKTIPKGQMKLYNILVPIFRIVDKILFNRVGLSVVVVGEKQ